MTLFEGNLPQNNREREKQKERKKERASELDAKFYGNCRK